MCSHWPHMYTTCTLNPNQVFAMLEGGSGSLLGYDQKLEDGVDALSRLSPG